MAKTIRFCWGSAFLFTVFVCTIVGATLPRRRRNVVCSELPQEALTKILGPAFNSRYMSITEPIAGGFILEDEPKRYIMKAPDFYVDGGYARELGDEPAWSFNRHHSVMVMDEAERPKRDAKAQRQWECESKIVWTDLGLDYFPRYVRNVECTAKRCWYGMYKCTPRSFTVKVLKRRRGKCVESRPGTKVGETGLHTDLKELWVWEERAVNFCCDCSF